MRVHSLCCFSLLLTTFCSTSCSGPPPGPKINKVPVVSVRGSVTVDGKPEAGVIVRCIPVGAFQPAELSAALGGRTNEDGEFTLSTYEIDDGVPPGDYTLLFVWPTPSLKKQSRADEEKNDRLKGRYSKAGQAAVKIKVEADQPQILDEIELKTK